MARMLPEAVPGRLTKASARIYRELKKIDADDLVCRISYAMDATQRPEFFVLYKECYVFLIAVSEASTEEADALLQGDLFASGAPAESLDLAGRHRMEAFVATLMEDVGGQVPDEIPIEKWLLFPKAAGKSVARIAELVNWPGYRLLGKESCRSDAIYRHFQESARSPLDNLLLGRIQGKFSPEIAIPTEWVRRTRASDRSHSPTQTDYFLDYDQEAAVKRDLELSNEGQQLAEALNLRLITGVAGCGKTLVLLFRARMMANLQSGSSLLVLTHNKPLRADLEDRIRRLDAHTQLQWATFYSWIRSLMAFEVVSPRKQKEIIAKLVREHLPEIGLSVTFLCDEFEWICDHGVQAITEEWYLNVERVGRQKALQKNQRSDVFKLFQIYREDFERTGMNDWSGIPVKFLRKIRKGEIRLNRYDAIFIDEAQFFAPVWFACVKEALDPERGQLFMVADPTQGFLRNGQSWQQVLGSEVRGRSHRLERPYRNTRQILAFARQFYLRRLPLEDGEVNLPDDAVLGEMHSGEEPRLLRMATGQDERARIANEISAALTDGLSPGQILVIHADSKQVVPLIQHLDERHPGQVVDATEASGSDKIRVCSLNACTGIEAPVVIFLGIDSLFEREGDLNLDETEQAERIRSNTKKIFVAFTRATRRLLICYRRESVFRAIQAASIESHATSTHSSKLR